MAFSSRGSVRRLLNEECEPRRFLSAVTFASHDISVSEANRPQSILATDVDDDGDMDVLSASLGDDRIAWYENTDGNGSFGTRKVVTTAPVSPRSLHAADVDGDGDMDVVSELFPDVVWHENTDGKGSFREPQRLISRARGGFVHAADVDGDGDVDILSASGDFIGNEIVWYENIDGRGTFGERRVVSSDAPGISVSSLRATDMDGDDDADLLFASLPAGGSFVLPPEIAWYENVDGLGTFGDARSVYAANVQWDPFSFDFFPFRADVLAADVDGDGDVDVLSISGGGSTFGGISGNMIAWYENTDGMETFGEQKVIESARRVAPTIQATDLDGDGDVDVVSHVCTGGPEAQTVWYENADGSGTYAAPKPLHERNTGFMSFVADEDFDVSFRCSASGSVHAVDVDRDHDVDVLLASGNIVWYENGPIQPGDANRDIQFDQLDIVQVLQSAKYLTGEPATFEEGDWNGDGVFDPLDIVAALQTGHYLQGPNASVAPGGVLNDGQTSIIYTRDSGEIAVDAPAGKELTSIYIDSDACIFTDGPLRNVISEDFITDCCIFVGAGGVRFASHRFGNVAQKGLSEEFVRNDVSVFGSLDGGGALGNVDLIYRPIIGESNCDAAFDQLDIVQVLQAAKYLTGQPATFAEGDFNGDGLFDQLDIVAAVETSTYQANARLPL